MHLITPTTSDAWRAPPYSLKKHQKNKRKKTQRQNSATGDEAPTNHLEVTRQFTSNRHSYFSTFFVLPMMVYFLFRWQRQKKTRRAAHQSGKVASRGAGNEQRGDQRRKGFFSNCGVCSQKPKKKKASFALRGFRHFTRKRDHILEPLVGTQKLNPFHPPFLFLCDLPDLTRTQN